jgi:hypothetical protein
MNKQPSNEQIQNFKYKVKIKCDKRLTAATANACLQAIDPTTLSRMGAAIYMPDTDYEWVINKLEEHKNTFDTSEVI